MTDSTANAPHYALQIQTPPLINPNKCQFSVHPAAIPHTTNVTTHYLTHIDPTLLVRQLPGPVVGASRWT